MMDAGQDVEPDLPQLPPPSTLPARLGQLGPKAPAFARIPTEENFAGTSSDPPVFSSDDVPAGSENYASRRKKPSRVGPWWESSEQHQQQSQRPRKKRRMEGLGRNLDSGVFMGKTDSAIPSSDFLSSELDLPPTIGLDEPDFIIQSQPIAKGASLEESAAPGDEYTRWGPPQDLVSSFYCQAENESEAGHSATRSDAETIGHKQSRRNPHMARNFRLRLSPPGSVSGSKNPALVVVERAVENGMEDIDLSGQFVWHDQIRKDMDSPFRLDERIFHPLHHLVKTRSLHDPDRFDSLVPDMRLWLSNNQLEALPEEIYRLRNLTKLGLRQNKLKVLSPSIVHLERLQFLNLTGNRIVYLPWEILQLKYLSSLFVDVGHLYQPDIAEDLAQKIRKTSNGQPHLKGPTVAVSQISWLDTAGIPVARSPPRPSQTSRFDPASQETKSMRPTDEERYESRALSLSDFCLRSAVKSPDLQAFLQNSSRVSALPTHLTSLLTTTMRTEQTGGLACSVCTRRFAVPRAEWLEWVLRGSGDLAMFLPLLRTACSWACARKRAEEGERSVAVSLSRDSTRSKNGTEDGADGRGITLAWGCGWSQPSCHGASARAKSAVVSDALSASSAVQR